MLGVIQNSKGDEFSKYRGEGTFSVGERNVTFSELLNCNVSVDTGTQTVNPLKVFVVDALVFENWTGAGCSKLNDDDINHLVFFTQGF